MELHDKPNQNSKSTQTETEGDSNIGKGRQPIIEDKHGPLFQYNEQPTPEYRHKLQQVLGEAFLAEAITNAQNLQNIIRIVEKQDWGELKQVSKYYYIMTRPSNLSIQTTSV